jgi:hypothetical protein
MNTKLENLYIEVSKMAPWLNSNFKGKTKHRGLVTMMINNPITPFSKDAWYYINHCSNFLNVREETFQVLLEEVKQVFRYNCNREEDQLLSVPYSLNQGISIPKSTTQFYWRELNTFKVIQFHGLISLQTGDLLDFLHFLDYFPSGNYYVKDKVTQFDKGGMTTLYWIGLWNDGPVEQ